MQSNMVPGIRTWTSSEGGIILPTTAATQIRNRGSLPLQVWAHLFSLPGILINSYVGGSSWQEEGRALR